MKAKRLRPEDSEFAWEAIRKLKQPRQCRQFSSEAMQRFLSKPDNILIVAWHDGNPAGFLLGYLLDRVDSDQQMVCVYEVDVSERLRRRGCGRAMIEVLKGLCRDVRATKAWTVTELSNEAAVGLFESTGAVPGPTGDDVTFVWSDENWKSDMTTFPR